MDRFVGTVVSVLVGLLVSLPAFAADLTADLSADLSGLSMSPKIVTLIHIGDIHGHLVPQPNLKIKPTGEPVGGLARLYTKIQQIRQKSVNTLLINAGDTTQGSAEALFTRGQAMVNVLNHFDIDAFAPGNWDFVYGLARFQQLFIGTGVARPLAQPSGWTALAANAYSTSVLPCGALGAVRILPPYVVKKVGDLKVGILGFTTDRGPQVVGTNVTAGICFTKGDAEVPVFVKKLRDPKPKGGEAVDLVVMVSELGLANNIRLAEKFPGIDVILSSDMHERTPEPVVTSTGTVIVEEGEGGAMLGELTIKIGPNSVKEWTWTAHIIDSDVAEDPTIAEVVAAERKTFLTGPDFVKKINPFNLTLLQNPIDTIVGNTTIPLHRANFSDEPMPAVIEGSSHDFLTDAFRAMGMADIGAIRGFRYGAHVAPGPITLADLYNYIPIGPLIAKGTISGAAVRNQIECAADGALNPLVELWTGGWLFNFSGLTMDINPYGLADQPLVCPPLVAPVSFVRRAFNIMVRDWETNTWARLDPLQSYSYASYYYRSDPCLINRVQIPDCINGSNITVVADIDEVTGEVTPLDGTEVVVRYLHSLGGTVTPELNRIHLLEKLPPPICGNPEIQPLKGAWLVNPGC
jgi:sulfur-oxidizing protein SoxB